MIKEILSGFFYLGLILLAPVPLAAGLYLGTAVSGAAGVLLFFVMFIAGLKGSHG